MICHKANNFKVFLQYAFAYEILDGMIQQMIWSTKNNFKVSLYYEFAYEISDSLIV